MAPAQPENAPTRPTERITWLTEPDRNLLRITVAGPLTDDDLLRRVPLIWESDPRVIHYHTVVDARFLNDGGGWTWNALRQVAASWRAVAPKNPGNKRTAIVTNNFWIALLVDKTFAMLFTGMRCRCFETPTPALAWALSDEVSPPERDKAAPSPAAEKIC